MQNQPLFHAGFSFHPTWREITLVKSVNSGHEVGQNGGQVAHGQRLNGRILSPQTPPSIKRREFAAKEFCRFVQWASGRYFGLVSDRYQHKRTKRGDQWRTRLRYELVPKFVAIHCRHFPESVHPTIERRAFDEVQVLALDKPSQEVVTSAQLEQLAEEAVLIVNERLAFTRNDEPIDSGYLTLEEVTRTRRTKRGDQCRTRIRRELVPKYVERHCTLFPESVHPTIECRAFDEFKARALEKLPRDEVTQDQLEHLVEEAVLTVTSRLTAASEAMEDLIEAAMSEGNRRAASTVIEGAWWAKRWFRAFGTPFEELLHEALVRIPGVAVNLAAAGKLTSRFSPLTPVRLVVRRARFTALSDLRERRSEQQKHQELALVMEQRQSTANQARCEDVHAEPEELQTALLAAIKQLPPQQKLAVGILVSTGKTHTCLPTRRPAESLQQPLSAPLHQQAGVLGCSLSSAQDAT